MAYRPPYINPAHRGLLHEELDIPKGKKIGIAELMKDKLRSKLRGNPGRVKRDTFAINARGWNHAG